MAAKAVPYHRSLAKRSEVFLLAQELNRNVSEVLLSLLDLWLYVEQYGMDGMLGLAKIHQLHQVIDNTDMAFFVALVERGWLVEDDSGVRIPGWTRSLDRFLHNRYTAPDRAWQEGSAHGR